MTILVRLLLSAFLGGLIGLEREMHGCAAGLRTHILVGMGSSLFVLSSIFMVTTGGFSSSVDPTRIAAQVVTGIGFLGAGSIVRYGAAIRGLTTAASIWAVAAMGVAVGVGMYPAAVFTAIVSLSILFLSRFEERLALRKHGSMIRVTVKGDPITLKGDVKRIIDAHGGRIKSINSERSEDRDTTEMLFELIHLPRTSREDIKIDIAALPDVENVIWHA
ncbi:MAG: MgtC/SapB family protein [Candidatus Omnitrophica bacterium]|nr:MgtC/SapB family protein [Candidatus Omnitrophota bacterium]